MSNPEKPIEQQCLDKINIVLAQFNCLLKADFIVNETGVYPRIFVIQNQVSNQPTSDTSENIPK